MSNCILCMLREEKIEVTKVYEDDKVTAILDIQPINPGHILIFPNECNQYVVDVDDETLKHMMIIAKRMNKAIRDSSLKCEDVNFFMADGVSAGQEIPHCHLHVFPRFKGDGFGLKFPNDYTNKPERSELIQVAEIIKEKL